jgi:uncharacterized protein DUF2586
VAKPDVTINVQDFGLGVVEPGAGKAQLAVGVCVGGAINAVYGFGAVSAAKSRLKAGKLLEAVVSKLDAGSPTVFAVRANPSTYGAPGAIAHAGPGSGTVTAAAAPHKVVLGKITTAGTLGTMAIAFSVDGGAYAQPITSVAGGSWIKDVDDTFLRITFPAGTYVLNEVYTFATDGTDSKSGAGPVATKTASPVDDLDVIIEVRTDGALGVSTFRYSLDNGDVYSGDVQIPAGGKVALTDAGIVVTFAGTFTAGDLYTFNATAPSYSTSDLNTALDAANADTSQWAMVHIVGMPTTAAGAASVAAAVDTKMTAAAGSFRFARAMVECPQTEGDTAIKAAFASFSSLRVGIACGDFEHLSPLTGRLNRRNAAWAAMARAGQIEEGEALHFVGRGSLVQVKSLYRDEGLTPGLDDARFITLTTFAGYPGYFVTRGRLMAPGGSDFSAWANGRVMDRACTIARAIALPIVGKAVRVERVTGKIVEVEAKRIESLIKRAIEADLVARGQASDVLVVVDRAANILSTSRLPIDVGVIPLGYGDFVTITMHFINPALA